MAQSINNCIELSSNIYCTGCGACVAACKFNAVSMVRDDQEFVTPCLDEELCKNCGICKASCYKFSGTNEGMQLSSGRVLAVYSNSAEVKRRSSSGGAAHEIAVWAIDHGYEVWGVAYDCEKNIAYHTSAHTTEELGIFQGSKYIQSDTGKLMEAIRAGEIKDKAVIFGTPCQIYALSKLKKDRDWILVDIFCSGVPTYLVWDKYLKYISKKFHLGKIADVKFRDKRHPWHDCYISITDTNGQIYTNPAKDDLFYSFFLSKKVFRDSCFDCEFKLNKTCADLRIGDFWGKRFNDNNTGVSEVIVNSGVGDKIINSLVKENIVSVEEASFDDVLESQHIINKSWTPDADRLRSMLSKKSINQVYWKFLAKPYHRTIAKKLYHSLPNPIYRFLKKLRGYE